MLYPLCSPHLFAESRLDDLDQFMYQPSSPYMQPLTIAYDVRGLSPSLGAAKAPVHPHTAEHSSLIFFKPPSHFPSDPAPHSPSFSSNIDYDMMPDDVLSSPRGSPLSLPGFDEDSLSSSSDFANDGPYSDVSHEQPEETPPQADGSLLLIIDPASAEYAQFGNVPPRSPSPDAFVLNPALVSAIDDPELTGLSALRGFLEQDLLAVPTPSATITYPTASTDKSSGSPCASPISKLKEEKERERSREREREKNLKESMSRWKEVSALIRLKLGAMGVDTHAPSCGVDHIPSPELLEPPPSLCPLRPAEERSGASNALVEGPLPLALIGADIYPNHTCTSLPTPAITLSRPPPSSDTPPPPPPQPQLPDPWTTESRPGHLPPSGPHPTFPIAKQKASSAPSPNPTVPNLSLLIPPSGFSPSAHRPLTTTTTPVSPVCIAPPSSPITSPTSPKSPKPPKPPKKEVMSIDQLVARMVLRRSVKKHRRAGAGTGSTYGSANTTTHGVLSPPNRYRRAYTKSALSCQAYPPPPVPDIDPLRVENTLLTAHIFCSQPSGSDDGLVAWGAGAGAGVDNGFDDDDRIGDLGLDLDSGFGQGYADDGDGDGELGDLGLSLGLDGFDGPGGSSAFSSSLELASSLSHSETMTPPSLCMALPSLHSPLPVSSR